MDDASISLPDLNKCVQTLVKERIPGDLVDTGVWRGGASIFMRALLVTYGHQQRVVWCADPFQGLPTPDVERCSQDKRRTWHLEQALAVSVDAVRANFEHFNLLDDRVTFVVDRFKDTLPGAPIDNIAVLRLDGDLYGSTMDALNALDAKVSPGGFIIVNDYGLPKGTRRRAAPDFCDAHGATEPITDIDSWGTYWQLQK